jgi:hypothetical protein
MYDVQTHPMHTQIQQHTYRRRIHHILQDGKFKFSNPDAFPFLSAFIIPLGIMVNYGDIQFVERIMVARRSEMSAEWKVMFAI